MIHRLHKVWLTCDNCKKEFRVTKGDTESPDTCNLLIAAEAAGWCGDYPGMSLFSSGYEFCCPECREKFMNELKSNMKHANN